MKRLAFVLGTRPEIIKLSPVIRAARRAGVPFFIIHTNQHYSPALDTVFFKELGVPKAKYHLRAGGGTQGEQIGKMLRGIEKILAKEKPSIVIVQGDTNSVFAGAFAAKRAGIPVAHVEAGLRSYDNRMPEETNRVLVDHISEMLFAPTFPAKKILSEEGISPKKIFVTGNTVVDALRDHVKIASKKSRILEYFELRDGKYALATFHRAENVDTKKNLEGILKGLALVASRTSLPVIVPLHPRTASRIKKFKLKYPQTIQMVYPLGYFDFLRLERSAKIILTDSGGLQEEACTLRVPCVTLRENTERPETVTVGANILGGTDPQRILRATRTMLRKKKNWKTPFGTGRAGEQIIRIIKKSLS